MKQELVFPRWLYHKEFDGKIIYDLNEYQKLGPGWDCHAAIYGDGQSLIEAEQVAMIQAVEILPEIKEEIKIEEPKIEQAPEPVIYEALSKHALVNEAVSKGLSKSQAKMFSVAKLINFLRGNK